MHPLIRALACVAILGTAGLTGTAAGLQESERITRVITLGEAGELDVSNVSGRITIRAGEGPDVRIEAVKRAQTGAQFDAVSIEIHERAQRVEIRTEYGMRNIRVSVDYDIVVPPGTRVTARSVSGDVDVTGVRGDLRVESVSGSVRLQDVARLTSGKSVSGRLDLVNVATEGDLTVGTVSGALNARGVRARMLDAESVSGRLELLDVHVERIAARTVSGRIQFEGPLASRGRYQFRSHSGAIRIDLAGPTGFELDANTFSGSVRTDVPLRLVGAAAADPRGRQRTLRGVYGDGSALLDVTTFSGSISLAGPN